jgi:DNA-binding transcriptional regulator YhcF (GntR family)
MSLPPPESRDRPLELTVDRDADLPLGVQLALKLRGLIATGALRRGRRLPGVRELADSAGVNVNTARSVYARLEEEGWVTSRQGRGTHVAPDAPSRPELLDLIRTVEAKARALGLGRQELGAAMYVGSDALQRDTASGTSEAPPTPDPRPTSDERTLRRAFQREIADLETQLEQTRGVPGDPPQPQSPKAAGRILTLAELRALRDELRDRLADRQLAAQQLHDTIVETRSEIEAANRAYLASQALRSHEATGTSTSDPKLPVRRVAWTY